MPRYKYRMALISHAGVIEERELPGSLVDCKVAALQALATRGAEIGADSVHLRDDVGRVLFRYSSLAIEDL